MTVGQEELIEQLMIALLTGGHCLLEGPPGVARALTARSLATVLGLRFARIRCTPDLTPSDIMGAGPLENANNTPERAAGPLFAHMVLVDDAGQLSPKANSVIQQAVAGPGLIVEGHKISLPCPYLLICSSYVDTEFFEKTPEPQDDRFMFKLTTGYPSADVEYRLADLLTRPQEDLLAPQFEPAQLLACGRKVLEIAAPPHVFHYAVRLVRATRVHEGDTPDFAYEWISRGAGPRATHYLVLAAKARAALRGLSEVRSEDVRQAAPAVLRHRIVTNNNAQNNGVSADQVIDRLLYEISEREPGDDRPS